MSSIKFIPPVIAHRGASQLAPENTLASFIKAKAIGAKWVEFDVMLAACGEAVVIHDETLERTTNGKGNVVDYPYSYLKTLDAGSWFSEEFAGEKIPTFVEVINCLRQHGLSANVEIKALPENEEETVKKVLADMKQHWMADMMQPLLSSFSMPALHFVKQYAPQTAIGVLVHEWFPEWEDVANKLQSFSVNLNDEIVDRHIIKKIKTMNKAVLCYTVNDPLRAKELFSWGVDAVFSDNADKIIEIVG